MSEAITLARPYARAAFELAQTKGTLNQWSAALAFARAVAGETVVANLRNDPRVSLSALVVLHMPDEIAADTPFARFLGELAEHGRLALLPEIVELFEAMKREAESILKVNVTSAMALDTLQAERLKVSLKRRFRRDIELHSTVDAALIGGAIIHAGDEVIDGSVRGRLKQLAGALS